MSTNYNATPQAGVLAGENPLAFNSSDPLPLFVIQPRTLTLTTFLGVRKWDLRFYSSSVQYGFKRLSQSIVIVIVGFCRLLSIPLARIRQPTAIAEVLGGIILGPSVLGRIPNFQATLFPSQSLPFINLMANLGLVLFLFLIGLEIDLNMVRQGTRRILSIAVCGMALPFALGVAVSYGLYNLESNKSVPFGSFVLFLGVAMAITASPVLARILAELKLLKTNVGAITMSAGLLNDCTAWALLALVVAFLNATSTLTALWVFLCAVAWGLFIIYIVGPLFRRLCVITGSFENGPSPVVTTILLMMILFSAFVTDIIGVHPIFGGFLVGVIVPHDGVFVAKVTEKIKDLVNMLLPLYFALSGLNTQIGLLNSGEVWGFVFLTVFVACFGKVVGCTFAAKLSGMTWRESATVGFLMNFELIVLNLGHKAGVINDTIFVIMVVMALVTTCMTTPIVLALYPVAYQRKCEHELLEKVKARQTDIESTSHSLEKQPDTGTFRLMLSLNNMQYIPSIMALIQMLQHKPKSAISDTVAGRSSEELSTTSQLEIHALRLIELTQRTSAVMMMQESQNTINRDPVVSVIRAFARLNQIDVKAHLTVSTTDDFAKNLTEQAAATKADMIIMPWDDHVAHQEGLNPPEQKDAIIYNPHHAQFVLKVFLGAICPVGLLFDRGFGVGQTDFNDDDSFGAVIHHPAGMTEQHILVPFFGGIDDREAVKFALKLSSFPGVSVTVLRLVLSDDKKEEKEKPSVAVEGFTLPSGTQTPIHGSRSSSPLPGPANFQYPHLLPEEIITPTLTMTSNEHLHSHVVDNALIRLLSQQLVEAPSVIEETELTEQLRNEYFGTAGSFPAAAKKVQFAELRTDHPLQDATAYAREHLQKKDLLIVGRRKARGLWSFKEEITRAFEKHVEPAEQQEHGSTPNASLHHHAGQSEMRKVLGDVAQGMWVAGVTASLLVVQAKMEKVVAT
ncbi:Sodium/hydrogen exchanger family-domain-containing protein [Endogone sp. FLAS-F59071]|nr:Sodium/hydrogen exchanger family-domain-containing protein [Endogone sp. FLAS-F59071]|eukprot:RUS17961.1 Sodium/hydrogen exchanger family-domain-containing protein [Endogone sp. FLAS-F59071]